MQVASGDLRSSLSSFSRERLALAWFGTRGPESSLPPGPPPALWGCSLALGRCRRACQQGQDESQSSDWPLRHRPLLPAQGRRFSLFWTGFVAFPNQAVLSCSKRLYFSREILQEGNFPLGGCDLAQLGRGVERGSWERPRGESSAENVDASPLGHQGWPGSSRPHCHRTSALGLPRHPVESWHPVLLWGVLCHGHGKGRELDSPHRGRCAALLSPLVSGSPGTWPRQTLVAGFPDLRCPLWLYLPRL